MNEYEEERKMEYVTSIEQLGIEKGMQVGSAGITLRVLQRRFGPLDEAMQSHIRALPLEQLEELSDALLDFAALSDLEGWLQQHSLPSAPSAEPETRNSSVQ